MRMVDKQEGTRAKERMEEELERALREDQEEIAIATRWTERGRRCASTEGSMCILFYIFCLDVEMNPYVTVGFSQLLLFKMSFCSTL